MAPLWTHTWGHKSFRLDSGANYGANYGANSGANSGANFGADFGAAFGGSSLGWGGVVLPHAC